MFRTLFAAALAAVATATDLVYKPDTYNATAMAEINATVLKEMGLTND